MCYLAGFIEVDSFHPGVERMGFMLPQGVMNEVIENNELTPFITPSSQSSQAAFLFEAFTRPVLARRLTINIYSIKFPSRCSSCAGPHVGAGPSPTRLPPSAPHTEACHE